MSNEPRLPDDELLRPISASLEHAFEETLAKIPADKKLFAGAGISDRGLQLGAGFRRAPLSLSGYAARLWGGSGWIWGARAR